MATSYTLSLLLNAVDKATGPIKAVITGLSELGKSAQQVAAATTKIGEEGTRNIDKFRNSISLAQKNMEQLNQTASRIVRISAEMIAIGGAMSAAFLFPVKQAAEFEQMMSKVKAVSGATADDMQNLKKAAHELGLTTKFTATEVAAGMVDLGQAGLKTNQIIAAMPPIINLASAGMLGLAEATDIVISVMYGMQLGVTDLTHVTDVLAKTAVETNSDVQQLGEAMKYTASAAAAAGVSLDETAAAIGVLSNAGIKSTMAGTTLRGMLVKLADPTKEARDALDSLGVSINDSSGKMRNFTDILSDLKKSGMTLQDAAKIFDMRAATGAIALTKNIDKLRELTLANKESFGSTAEMAATMLDNIKGAWVNFMATIEAFSQAVVGPMAGGIKVLIDALNKFLQLIIALVEATNPLSSVILALVGAFGALLVVGGSLGLMLAGLIKLFGLLATAMAALTVSGATAATTTGTLATSVTALKGILNGLIAVLVAVGRAVLLIMPGWVVAAIAVATYALYKWVTATEAAAKAANSLANSTRKSRESFDQMRTELNKLTPGTMQYEEALNNLIQAYPELAHQLQLSNQSLEEQKKILDEYRTSLVTKEVEALGGAIAANQTKLSKMMEPGKGLSSWQEIRKAMGGLAGYFNSIMMSTSLDEFKKRWKATTDWVAAYGIAKQHENRVQYEAQLTLMTQQFRQLGEAIGMAPEEFIKKSKDQLEELFKSNEQNMELFRAQWVLAGGDMEGFVKAAQAAQKKIADAMKPPETELKSPVEKMVEDAQASVGKMKGVNDTVKSDFKVMISAMQQSLENQPVSVQMAWKKAIDTIIEEYNKIPNKTADVMERMRRDIATLNTLTMMGGLAGTGPTAFPIPGAENLGFKAGTDISSMRKQAGDRAAAYLSNAIVEASRQLGIDPAIALGIIGQGTGGAFNLIQSPIKGTMWGGQASHAARGSWGGDIGAAAGTPVYAPKDMTITASKLKMSDAPGGMVYAVTDDGTVYRFIHIDPSVAEQMKVKAGQEIGKLSDIAQPHLDMKVKDAQGNIVDWTEGMKRGQAVDIGQVLGKDQKVSVDLVVNPQSIPQEVRKIQEQLVAEGKEVNLWNILFKMKGDKMPAEEFKKYYESVARSIAGYQKGGGVEFYTAEQLKIEKQRIDQALEMVKAAGNKQLAGKMETLDKEKTLVLEQNLNEQKQLAVQMAQAQKEQNFQEMFRLQTRMQQLKMAATQSMKMLGMEEVAIQRENEAAKAAEAIKGAEFRTKIEEDAVKRQEVVWKTQKTMLEVAYAQNKITAQEYYSAVAGIEEQEYQASKAIVDKKIADAEAVWAAKMAAEAKRVQFLDQDQKSLALAAMQRQAEEAMLPLKTQKANLEQQHAEALAKSGAALAKQREMSIERFVVDKELANALGPVAEEEAKILQLKEAQNREMKQFNEYLAQQVAMFQQSKGMYGMSPEEAEAWRKRLEASNSLQIKNQTIGQEAKRWAETVANGISSLVDSLLDGTQDLKKSLNSFFKTLFKSALEPGIKALTQWLTDAFTSMFGSLGKAVGNAVMGVIALIGMLLTSGGGKSEFTASSLESGVTTHEATRGVIAGETSLPIAEISTSLSEAVAPHLSVLRQIETNTRGGTTATGVGPANSEVSVIVQGVSQSIKATLDEYFREYLLTGAK